MLVKNRTLTLIAASIALALAAPAAPASAALRDDADWYEYFFNSADGVTQLHADVLLPKGTPRDGSVKLPVIMTASPYTNHNGSTTDTDLNGTGPNPRFYDFLDLSGALTKGYAYVMVDLPGDGGSSGCNDWGGSREQLGVRAGVEWAASQPWSNGKVALLGKSYDAWTGLMGVAQQPQGLAAVASLEPVYEGYRYMYMNGVRRNGSWPATMALFQAIDAKPGRPSDSPQYLVNSAPQAWCYPVNLAGNYADDDPHGPYWEERNLIDDAVGKTTPVFLTQGFLETNTKSDGAFQYWNNLAGDENRGWFGQFDHARCWEKNNSGSTPSGNNTRWQMGREGGCLEELMRFFDEHLKGIEPPIDDPTVEVQDIRGRWRAETSFPPEDSRLYVTDLNTGSYTDDGSGGGLRPTEGQGIWTVSQPLPHEVWLSGEPVITAGVDAVPKANFAANVYDIAEGGSMTMISRGVSVIRGTGTRTVSYTMYGQDWPIPAGHRIGVLISDADQNEFTHVATRSTVTVRSAKIALPFLRYDRTEFIPTEETTPRLESYIPQGGAVLSEAKIASSQRAFNLPGPLQPKPAEA